MQRKADRRWALVLAAAMTIVIALVHVGALFVGPDAFDYLGAPELAKQLRTGARAFPIGATLFVVVGLSFFVTYALSGARVLRRLPRLRAVLCFIGAVFVLRGLGIIWFSYLWFVDSPDAIFREIGFSFVSLLLGCLFLWGRTGVSGSN